MTEFQAVNENTRSPTYDTIHLRTLTLTITQLVNPAIGRSVRMRTSWYCAGSLRSYIRYDIPKWVSHTRVDILQVYYCGIRCYTRVQGNSDFKSLLTTWSSKQNPVVGREASVLEIIGNWLWPVLWLWQPERAKKTTQSHTIFVIRVKIRKIVLGNSLYSKLEESG